MLVGICIGLFYVWGRQGLVTLQDAALEERRLAYLDVYVLLLGVLSITFNDRTLHEALSGSIMLGPLQPYPMLQMGTLLLALGLVVPWPALLLSLSKMSKGRMIKSVTGFIKDTTPTVIVGLILYAGLYYGHDYLEPILDYGMYLSAVLIGGVILGDSGQWDAPTFRDWGFLRGVEL